MKKTLAALAVLGAFAGSSMAADVVLYGRIDTGLYYTHSDIDVANTDATDNLQMKSGISTGNRWGMKGSEELGNGLKVGFSLESGFNADAGTMGEAGRLFNRESLLWVEGGFGKVALGRTNSLATDGGMFNMLGSVNSFGTGWSNIGSQSIVMSSSVSSRYNNTVTYATPTFGGFQIRAQYSMGNANENTSKDTRYAGLGVSYNVGNLSLVAVAENVNEASAPNLGDQQDEFRLSVGGNYNFGVATVYGLAHYFKDADSLTLTGLWGDIAGGTYDELEGYGVVLGADVPVAGGTVKLSAGYVDAEDKAENAEFEAKGYYAGAGYKYPLSKRTYVYGAAGYFKADLKNYGAYTGKPSSVQATLGMAHYF